MIWCKLSSPKLKINTSYVDIIFKFNVEININIGYKINKKVNIYKVDAMNDVPLFTLACLWQVYLIKKMSKYISYDH